jgi:hypothetical protein
MTEQSRELTPEEQQRGERIMRRCDAFSLLRVVLDDAASGIPNTAMLENASDELRILEMDASNALQRPRAL